MPRNETSLEKVQRLQADRNVLMTKGGTLNEGELKWIAHIEDQLAEYGIFYNQDQSKVA